MARTPTLMDFLSILWPWYCRGHDVDPEASRERGAVEAPKVRFQEPGRPRSAVAAVGFLCGALVVTGIRRWRRLHAAPLNRDMMGGAYHYGDTIKQTGSDIDDEVERSTSPDLAWLRFADMMLGTSRLTTGGPPSDPPR